MQYTSNPNIFPRKKQPIWAIVISAVALWMLDIKEWKYPALHVPWDWDGIGPRAMNHLWL